MSILNTSKTGIYKVTTLSGSIYLIDLDNSKGKRLPGVGAGALVADQNWFHIVSIDPFEINEPMFLQRRGINPNDWYTWRRTTPVSKIEPIER